MGSRVMRTLIVYLIFITTWFASTDEVTAQTERGRNQARDSVLFLTLINEHLERVWKENSVQSGETALDHVLLRRVSLDLIGRVPTAAEVRQYLADERSDKYVRLVERLLESAEFHRYLAVQLRRSWLPQLETQEFAQLTTDYQHWLTSALADQVPYDQLVYQQLTSPIDSAIISANPLEKGLGSPVFLTVADMEPARLAANASRAFLGLNLDCAQCHDHPFSRWSRDQFWQTAAFFSRQTEPRKSDPLVSNWCIQIEGTEDTVEAVFLDNTTTTVPTQGNVFQQGREAFADWTIDDTNPYFAQNAVNRIWNMLMGRPLVAPIDDLTEVERSVTGQLLKELASTFKATDYQLVSLVRAIVLSRSYQQRSVEAPDDDFASRSPRLIGSVQLVNSLRIVSGLLLDPDEIQTSNFGSEFTVDKPSESLRTTVQALMMMNGDITKTVCDPDSSPVIRSLSDSPFLSDDDKLDSLFLRTLSRFPTAEERKLAREFLDSQRKNNISTPQILADLLWILLNTAQFHVIE